MNSKVEATTAALTKSVNQETALNAPGARPFVHLHVHSAYSLLEGALPLAKVMALAEENNQPALAITDRSNLFGALEFSVKATKLGLQPIIGCTIEVELEGAEEGDEPTVAMNRGSSQEATRVRPILLFLCSNEQGYANLMKLVSVAYEVDSGLSRPHITFEQMQTCNEGLIVLSGVRAVCSIRLWPMDRTVCLMNGWASSRHFMVIGFISNFNGMKVTLGLLRPGWWMRLTRKTFRWLHQ